MNIEEFSRKLQVETILNYQESKCMVKIINNRAGNIEKAINIYENDGFQALITYRNQLSYKITQINPIDVGIATKDLKEVLRILDKKKITNNY